MKKWLLFFLIGITAYNVWGIEFEPGKKYHLFHFETPLRERANENSNVLVKLSFRDQVEIIEKNDAEGRWYKVRRGGITGYVPGSSLAEETVITDIDKNGTNDYFSHRFEGGGILTDMKIYINNKEVSTKELPLYDKAFQSRQAELGFYECRIVVRNYYVLVILTRSSREYDYDHIYKIYPDGDIQFIECVDSEKYNDKNY
jgi:hypothetical protein